MSSLNSCLTFDKVSGAKSQITDGVMEKGATGDKVDQVLFFLLYVCCNAHLISWVHVLPFFFPVYGIHLIASMPMGAVAVTNGPIMAASDTLRIVVEGPGGHGGMAAGSFTIVSTEAVM